MNEYLATGILINVVIYYCLAVLILKDYLKKEVGRR